MNIAVLDSLWSKKASYGAFWTPIYTKRQGAKKGFVKKTFCAAFRKMIYNLQKIFLRFYISLWELGLAVADWSLQQVAWPLT